MPLSSSSQSSPNKRPTTLALAGFLLLVLAIAILTFTLQKNQSYNQSTRAVALLTATPTPPPLPPVPPGLPGVFGFGLFNGTLSDMHAGVPYNYRYQYMAGDWINGYGANYVSSYINQTPTSMVPAFTLYRFCSLNASNGICTTDTEDPALSINDTTKMRTYYDEFKYLMQQIGGTSRHAIVILEPDGEGHMQQNTNGGDNAVAQTAAVASSGMPEFQSPLIENNYRGFHEGLAHLRDLYAPNTTLALTISMWGTGVDMTLCLRDGYCNATDEANRVVTYFNTFGAGWNLVAMDPLDRDASYYLLTQGSNRYWWNDDSREPKFSTFRGWLGTIINGTQKRAIMWQVPNGNRVYTTENNTNGHYQDNRTEYFLNSTNGRQHIQEWANVGLMAIMWGAGVGSQTHYWDYRSDGLGNLTPVPGPTNNPMGVAAVLTPPYADDDGGYIRLNVGNYYTQGAIPLPGVSTPTPTPTRPPPPSVTPIFTPTPTYTRNRADINRNGVITIQDYNLVKAQFGQACSSIIQPPFPTPTVPCADIECNGAVDINDFNKVKAEYGQSVPVPNLERYCDGSLPNNPTPTPTP